LFFFVFFVIVNCFYVFALGDTQQTKQARALRANFWLFVVFLRLILLDHVSRIRVPFIAALATKTLQGNTVVQEATKKKYLEEQLPVSLEALEKLLKENKNGDGFFVGDEVSE